MSFPQHSLHAACSGGRAPFDSHSPQPPSRIQRLRLTTISRLPAYVAQASIRNISSLRHFLSPTRNPIFAYLRTTAFITFSCALGNKSLSLASLYSTVSENLRPVASSTPSSRLQPLERRLTLCPHDTLLETAYRRLLLLPEELCGEVLAVLCTVWQTPAPTRATADNPRNHGVKSPGRGAVAASVSKDSIRVYLRHPQPDCQATQG